MQKQWLWNAVVVVSCVLPIAGCGRSEKSAEGYTAREVEEIIRLLREDIDCRDSRTDNVYSVQNSLPLWEAVLGKPHADASPFMTYKTRTGTVTVRIGTTEAKGVTLIGISPDVAVVSQTPNETVDSAALKAKILAAKKSIDPVDSKKFFAEREAEREKVFVAEQAERNEEKRKLDVESEQQQQEFLVKKDRDDSESDYLELRDELPVGQQQKTFVEKSEDWINRRAVVVTAARTRGTLVYPEDGSGRNKARREAVPLPTVAAILKALADGSPIPVVRE